MQHLPYLCQRETPAGRARGQTRYHRRRRSREPATVGSRHVQGEEERGEDAHQRAPLGAPRRGRRPWPLTAAKRGGARWFLERGGGEERAGKAAGGATVSC